MEATVARVAEIQPQPTQVLKPRSTRKSRRQTEEGTIGEPNWAPLERAVPVTDLENFMYMGCAGEIELYKHRFTRRYLNIGRNSQKFYRYLNGEYTEISQAAALEHVRG